MKKIILITLAILIVAALGGILHMRRRLHVEAINATCVLNDNEKESRFRVMVENVLYFDVLKNNTTEYNYFEEEKARRVEIFKKIYDNMDNLSELQEVIVEKESGNEATILKDILEAKNKNMSAVDFMNSDRALDTSEDNYAFYVGYMKEFIRVLRLQEDYDTHTTKYDDKEMFRTKGERVVYLTYDDGVCEDTSRLLKTLKEQDVRATFFVQGNTIEDKDGNINKANIDILEEMIENGNEVGVHSFSHPHLTKLEGEALSYEVSRTKELIEQELGYTPEHFRTPYGERNEKVLAEIYKNYKNNCIWDIDSQDWRTNFSKEIIINRIVKLVHLENGGIVLQHDVHKKTVDLSDELITRLKNCGFEFGVIDENYQ